MAETFDPYHKWLGIPPREQPVSHYRLLGIGDFESDPQVIESAADRQMAHVRTFQTGPHGNLSQKLLNELAAAKVCLLNPSKKAAYDATLTVPAAPVPMAAALPVAGGPWSAAGPVPVAQQAMPVGASYIEPDAPPAPIGIGPEVSSPVRRLRAQRSTQQAAFVSIAALLMGAAVWAVYYFGLRE